MCTKKTLVEQHNHVNSTANTTPADPNMSANVVHDDPSVVNLANEESNNTNQHEVTKVPTTTSTTLNNTNHIVGGQPTPPSEIDETKVPTTNSTTTDHSTTNNNSSINVNSAAEHKTTKVPINTETTISKFIIDHQQQINHNEDHEMSNVNNNQIEVRMSDQVNEGVTDSIIRYAHSQIICSLFLAHGSRVISGDECQNSQR